VFDTHGKEALSVVVCCFADDRAELLARCLDFDTRSTPGSEILRVLGTTGRGAHSDGTGAILERRLGVGASRCGGYDRYLDVGVIQVGATS
jgi:hypothetical protein